MIIGFSSENVRKGIQAQSVIEAPRLSGPDGAAITPGISLLATDLCFDPVAL